MLAVGCWLQEQALSTVEGYRRIITLSHSTLLHICRSCSTKVAYESTIVAAITAWWAAHPGASDEQLRELALTVCLRGLPRMFLVTVLLQLPWWKQVISEGGPLTAAQQQ